MADLSLHKLLGLPKERAEEIARKVRATFSESCGPEEWVGRLIDEFGIDEGGAEIFACGWFAGRYAGASEVFNVVQRKMNEMEKDQADKAKRDIRYPPPDGYA